MSRFTITFSLLPLYLITLHAPSGIFAQECAAGSATQYKGNWYCSPVKAITYSGFPGSGWYNKVTKMDAASGECESERYDYSGSLSPLNEELSVHIRGPVRLNQFAVYTSGNAVTKRSEENPLFIPHGHRHGHQHLHHRDAHLGAHGAERKIEEAKRQVGAPVTATVNGKVAVWTNSWAGSSTSTSSTPVSTSTTLIQPVSKAASSVDNYQAPPLSSSIVIEEQTNHEASTGSWTREAYYNAAGALKEGLIFLNHFGGQGSGTTVGGYSFGASLSYASSDGRSGSSSSQTLEDALIDDGVEIVILSDKPCKLGSCGYTRPGGVAYHGFAGSHKVFLFEFSMPDTSETGFNGNMPAIWLLNAQVPLTSQYGTNPECSCWTSGCGEFDLFEVLDAGDKRCKSTLHMAPAGGSSDYFERPTTKSLKAAAVFAGGNSSIHIQILDDGVEFGGSLSQDDVDGFMSLTGETGKSSLFKLAT